MLLSTADTGWDHDNRGEDKSATSYMGESPDDLSVYCANTIEARWLSMWGLIGEWCGRSR